MEVKIPIPIDTALKERIIADMKEIIKNKNEAKKKAQSYSILDRKENLMGIRNKAKIGNL